MLSEVWKEFSKKKLALIALCIVLLFFLVGLYAPLFASSKPLILLYDGKIYFPLFRYLYYPGFFTKPIDLFYNVLMITLPLGLLGLFFLNKKRRTFFLLGVALFHFGFYFFILWGGWKDPSKIGKVKRELLWQTELKEMNDYAKINVLLRHKQRKAQESKLAPYLQRYETEKKKGIKNLFGSSSEENVEHLRERLALAKKACDEAYLQLPTLKHDLKVLRNHLTVAQAECEKEKLIGTKERFEEALKIYKERESQEKEICALIATLNEKIDEHRTLGAKEKYLSEKSKWEAEESAKMKVLLGPLLRDFHWEEDAGGGQALNKYLPWWELTRINRKDLNAALLFGIRISLVVGVTTVSLALLLGVPLGVISGYFAGKVDIIVCRLIEIWEAMPGFFMLLLIVAIVQSKSLFLVIFVLAIFGWTHFTRYIRGEVLRQRNLPYVMAAHSMGFSHAKIMRSHILPNAIPPVLTLLPFSMMAAITAEAGLSFLGLGEEGSTSWGVLMAEGRSVFPGESYLLWPPAILLTILLVSIALVGDALRDALDPKMRS